MTWTNESKDLKIICLGEDITDYLIELQGVTATLDYPRLTEYGISSSDLTLRNPNNFFSPTNSNNFFVQNSGIQEIVSTEITIQAGFVGALSTIFEGRITEVRPQLRQDRITFKLGDNVSSLNNNNLIDFGIDRNIIIELDPESTEPLHGRYLIPEELREVSEGSISVFNGSEELTEVPELRDEGVFDSSRYTLRDGAVLVEGGSIGPTLRATFKSPYRHKTIKTLINNVLDHYDITKRNIELLEPKVRDHFATLGRIGYDSEFKDGRKTTWTGLPTDYIVDEANNIFYVLYSAGISLNNRSSILKLDMNSETTEVIYTHTSYSQFWRIKSSDFETFYILGTTGNSGRATYDATASNSQGTIWRYTQSTNTMTTYVDGSNTFKPQVGTNFILGINRLDQIVPDTNIGFELHKNILYYRYVSGNTTGVASASGTTPTTSRVIGINRDNRDNHLGTHFTIDNDTLYFSFTNVQGDSGRFVQVSKDLSTS